MSVFYCSAVWILHRKCLQFATQEKPLAAFLDSLDQLSNEDFGRNLKWLSLKEDLPEYTNVVVSTLPGKTKLYLSFSCKLLNFRSIEITF